MKADSSAWPLAIALAAVCVGVPCTTAAHGAPPAITRVLGADGSGPRFLALTEGHAAYDDGAWRYVCPAAYGLDTPAIGVSPDGNELWVVGGDGLYRIDHTGKAVAHGHPDLGANDVTEIAAVAGTLYLHRFMASGSRVVRLDAGEPVEIWSSDSVWQSMAGYGSGLALARVQDATLFVVELDGEGSVVRSLEHDLGGGNPSVRLRVAGGALYLTTIEGTAYGLRRVDDGALVTIADSDSSYLGPVRAGNDDLFVTSNAIFRIDAEQVTPLETAEAVTCLDSIDGQSYACSLRTLYRLQGDGLGPPVATLAELMPPVDPSVECGAQWRLFLADLGRGSADDAGGEDSGEDSGTGSGAGGGCRIAQGRDVPAQLWIWLVALASIRRVR